MDACTADRLRGQRRTRELFRHGVDRHRRPATFAGGVRPVGGALAAAAALLRYEERDVGWCSCGVENADAHAGHTETSVLLHISPDVVRLDERVPGNRAPLAELLPAMR